MTVSEAATLLKKMYEDGQRTGEAVTMIHRLGIKSASELQGIPFGEVSSRATGKESFKTEIRKGMKLTAHVAPK